MEIAGAGGEGVAHCTALNGSMHSPEDSDAEEVGEDEAESGEDDDGDTEMAGDASAVPSTAALAQHLGDGVGWVEEHDLQAAPPPAEGVASLQRCLLIKRPANNCVLATAAMLSIGP